MNQQKQNRNLLYLSDLGGTGWWRAIMPSTLINSIDKSLGIENVTTKYPIVDQNYYNNLTSVTIQRWIEDQRFDMFTRFLKPLSEKKHFWLVYNIDDAMHYDEIPLFNRGRAGYVSEKIQSNIKSMLNESDFVVVTTKYLKNYYHEKYNVPLENIIALPNLLGRYWFGNKYDIDKSVAEFAKNKAKPRIGIVSSLSHFNVDGIRRYKDNIAVHKITLPNGSVKWVTPTNEEVDYKDTTEIIDDIDEIVDVIKSTVNDVQWVFFGYKHPKLMDLFNENKIEFTPGSDILNYPNALKNQKLQCIVAPLIETVFNYCKSPIKYLEASALGIPLIAKRCLPYTPVMNDSMLYSTNDELKEKILKLKFSSLGGYKSIIESQYKWFNTPHADGDFTVKNCWLEDNLGIWVNLFKLPQKCWKISFKAFTQAYEQKQKNNHEVMFKSNNDVEILK